MPLLKSCFCFIALVFSVAISHQKTYANITLPAVFNDHMVLQQNSEVTIWGWAKAGEPVTLTLSWENKPITTKASNLAQWQVKIKTPAASNTPQTIKLQGYNTIIISDILFGEVWLCSGQSNMEWSARAGIDKAAEEIPKANYPSIRFFSVAHRTADSPQLSLDGEWLVCTPQTMTDFSAIGYFFGREVHQNLKVPVGLINSSWGGTPGEVWMNATIISKDPILSGAATKQKEVPYGPHLPGKAYNAMIAPLIPYRIAGALWYQGESNTSTADAYARLLPALINNWRTEWGYEFPFYFAQIAPYTYGGTNGAVLRDSQRRTLQVPKTGMVVTSDIGNIKDIHPRNKLDVGLRLANLALNQTYGKTDKPVSGPLYKSMKVEGNKIRITFDYAEGLVAKGKELTHFEIAGSDGKYIPATAKISGKTVVVQAKEIKNPTSVRFAWSDTAEPNLFNKAGLPASTFTTSN